MDSPKRSALASLLTLLVGCEPPAAPPPADPPPSAAVVPEPPAGPARIDVLEGALGAALEARRTLVPTGKPCPVPFEPPVAASASAHGAPGDMHPVRWDGTATPDLATLLITDRTGTLERPMVFYELTEERVPRKKAQGGGFEAGIAVGVAWVWDPATSGLVCSARFTAASSPRVLLEGSRFDSAALASLLAADHEQQIERAIGENLVAVGPPPRAAARK